MITEIFVENKKLDITADISSLLTFAIDDVKDFSSRQTAFSKTVVLPGTANNNAIFGNIFDTGISNNYEPALSNIGFNFNPAKSANCLIFQDNLQTFKGTLRILEIDIDKGRIEYQVALNGDLTTLNVALSSAYLTDLDFSNHDLLYNVANIAASWDNAPGSGVYFPMIDYGTYSTLKHDWDYHTFHPALYVKEYIDKMFAATSQIYNVISFGLGGNPTVYIDISRNGKLSIVVGDGAFTDKALTTVYPDGTYNVVGTDFGFTVVTGFVTAITNPSGSGPGTPTKYPNPNGNFRYQCDLFNTDRFKRLIVPHNQKVLQSLVTQVASAAITAPQEMISHSGSSQVVWDTVIAGGFSYAAGVFTYTQATSLSTTIAWKLTGTRYSDTTGTFEIQIRKNGFAVATSGPIATFPHPGVSYYSFTSSVAITLSTGDTIDFYYHYLTGTGMDVTIDNSATGYSTFTMTSGAATLQPVDYNQKITLNDSLPQNIRQIDFLVSIVKLFNLYVYESKFDERLILISPFVDFYTPISGPSPTPADWTYKLNRDQPIKIKPLSELNSKLYNFNYKADTDYWNDLYKKRYNQVYGSYIFDSQYEFADQTNTLELIFASTPLIGYLGEAKIYPTIFKRTGDVTGAGEETVDSVIRIMQTKKVFSVPSWKIMNGATILGTYNVYGYAGHLDDPDNPDNDLNFGALRELFFILAIGDLSKTQFNIYWSSYMAEITDKDSKLLTAKFYLTPIDIFNLDFSQFVYVDGVLFRLNKITDYNVSIPSDCEVELLKVINTAYTFPIGSLPEALRTIDWESADQLEYTPGNPILYL